jgi:hypothetical protein
VLVAVLSTLVVREVSDDPKHGRQEVADS